MQHYIKIILQATGEAWAVFKTAATTGKEPKLAFEQLREKFKDTDAGDYVMRYTKICEEELPGIKDPEAYIAEAKVVGNEVWKVFKDLVPKIFEKTMTDGDWNRIVQKTSSIGMSNKWKYAGHYAERYSAMLAWELDRKNRRLRGIMTDDLTEYLNNQ
jgi:hypothetical protein